MCVCTALHPGADRPQSGGSCCLLCIVACFRLVSFLPSDQGQWCCCAAQQSAASIFGSQRLADMLAGVRVLMKGMLQKRRRNGRFVDRHAV